MTLLFYRDETTRRQRIAGFHIFFTHAKTPSLFLLFSAAEMIPMKSSYYVWLTQETVFLHTGCPRGLVGTTYAH